MISICQLNLTVSRTNTNPIKTFKAFIKYFEKIQDKFDLVEVKYNMARALA